MSWERPTILQITKRIERGIESRLFGNVSLLRRAILRILARVFAGSIHTNYGHVDYVKDSILFVTTADDDALRTRHAPMWGINPRPGSFATGKVRFTGTNGLVIDLGTRLQSEDGIEFGTLVVGTIVGGYIDIDIQAIEDGLEGNITVPVGDTVYLQIISPISGVDSEVEIIQDITGGEDPEDTETLRTRILQRIQFPPMGGSKHDYERWSMEVSGVKRAWVYPLAYGPGTVATVITAMGTDPVPSSVLLNDVEAYIEERKPVTADHSVQSITDTSNNPGSAKVSMTIAIVPNEASYREKITTNLQTVLEPHIPGSDILISELNGAIAASGVSDYHISTIALDGVPQSFSLVIDISLSGFQYPVIDNLTFIDI